MEGFVESKMFPLSYPTGREPTDCDTFIMAPIYHNIIITFNQTFNVPCLKQDGHYVSGDFVEILDYSRQKGFKLLKKNPTPIPPLRPRECFELFVP